MITEEKKAPSNQAKRIALILKAMDDANEALAEFKADHKARMETLQKELNALTYEILTGQQSLPMEVA